MDNHPLFDSYTDAIPPVRHDIQQIPVQQNGHSLIYFHDVLGYATPNFALPSQASAVLSLIDGKRSVTDILEFSSDEVTKEEILGYIRFLDENGLLDSEHFAVRAEFIESQYEKTNRHYSITSGSSYPSEPDKLSAFLETAFKENEPSKAVENARGLYAPHIDPRLGMRSYVKAFSAIKSLCPKRVVILATSHYSGLYGELYRESPFIVSEKTFVMPNGEVKADANVIRELKKLPAPEYGLSFIDRAHRIEHSIELHLLFLNHIWQHHFTILPILVGSFDELLYLEDSYRSGQVRRFADWLHDTFKNDPNTFFMISGDLCHIGKKFGDTEPASEFMDSIRHFDSEFLQAGVHSDSTSLITLIKENLDAYRVCGFPPLYTYLQAFPDLKGQQLSYDIWDEKEMDSAVSFGSILFQ